MIEHMRFYAGKNILKNGKIKTLGHMTIKKITLELKADAFDQLLKSTER